MRRHMKPWVEGFCKESVLWIHISHPNVLELLAVNVDPETGALSIISELMENGNIMQYIHTNETNRIYNCLVRRSRLESSCELTVPKLDDVARGLSYLHRLFMEI